jgi:serine/threonine-protein kinase
MAGERTGAADLDDVILAYLEAAEAGRPPDRRQLLDRHPHLAGELAAFFADHDQFDSLVSPLRAGTPPPSRRLAPGSLSSPDFPLPPAPAPGGSFGDYELLEEAARGGMGVVYKARQKSVGRVVALKMIRWGGLATAEDVQRFRLEAEAAATLDHPNIVPIYEVGEHDGLPFFSMKLIDGGSVRGPADLRSAARLVATVARAVHHAHQRGILHRDLKPANILLDADGEPHVTDFGLAARLTPPSAAGSALLVEAGLTRSGIAVGTPSYMAPEQASGPRRAVTTAADVYSLGAVLFELLTGRPPFRGESALETLAQVIESRPPRPRSLAPAVPRDLETVCLKCLEKDPRKRYPTALALADDLQRFLDGEPILARPAGPFEKSWRWCRRNPVVASLSAGLLVALAAGMGLVTWQWLRAEREARLAADRLVLADEQRDRAERERAEADRLRVEADGQRDRAEREAELAAERLVQVEAERAAAEASLSDARQILDRLCVRVSEERLRNVPGVQPLRKEILENALAYYQRFLDKRADDPRLLRDVADTHQRVGYLTDAVGSRTAALASYRRALETYQKLLAADADNASLQEAVARTCINMGAVQEGVNDPKGALDSYAQARDLLVKLDERKPDDADTLGHLTAAYVNIGNVRRALGDLDDSRDAYEKALAAQDRLLAREPNNLDAQSDLALVYVNLAILHSTQGRKEEALRWHEKARAVQERLHRLAPGSPEFQRDLALTCRRIGDRLTRDGRPDEGLRSLEQGHALILDLADANPRVIAYQIDLAASHRGLGSARRGRGQTGEALQSYGDAAAILRRLNTEHPELGQVRHDLGNCLFDLGFLHASAGRPDDALRAYQEAADVERALARASPDNLDYRTDLGVTLGNLGLMLADVGRVKEALPVLREAIDEQRVAFARAPRVAQHRQALNRHYAALSGVQRRAGQPDECLRTLDEGLGLFRDLVKNDPETPEYLADLATAQSNAGYARRDLKQSAGALAAFRDARDTLEALVRLRPEAPAYRQELATAYFNLAGAHFGVGRRDEEQAAYEKSRDLLEKLVRDHPKNLDFRADLGRTLNNLGLTYGQLGQIEASLAALRQAVEHQRVAFAAAPHAPRYRRALSNHYGALAEVERKKGKPSAAAAALLERRRLWPSNPDELFRVAVDQAQTAAAVGRGRERLSAEEQEERDRYADQAVETLRQARAAGLRDREAVEKHPDLTLLRDRPEFSKLMSEFRK